MKRLRIKTSKMEIDAQEVPPWLAFAALIVVILTVAFLAFSGVWALPSSDPSS